MNITKQTDRKILKTGKSQKGFFLCPSPSGEGARRADEAGGLKGLFLNLFIASLFISMTMTAQTTSEQSFYDFEAKSLQGETINMSQYKGKVVLVVNTASKCGLTPQYEGLEKLYKTYKDKGLVILGFPCNQFLGQEPGTAEDIAEVCYVNYGVTFPMFDKIKVNGDDAHPIYKYLKSVLPGKIDWNFAKFLIDRDGNPVKRFSARTKPEKLEEDIKALL